MYSIINRNIFSQCIFWQIFGSNSIILGKDGYPDNSEMLYWKAELEVTKCNVWKNGRHYIHMIANVFSKFEKDLKLFSITSQDVSVMSNMNNFDFN